MQTTPLTIENLQIKNNVFLAPLAGYTDYPFRKLLLEHGVGLCFTELVSAKGLMYESQGSKELLYCGNDYQNTAVQIFGSDPYYMRSACESEYLSPFKIVDINMGCPVPKVYKNGEGSALLNDIKKAEEIILNLITSHEKTLKDPAPTCRIVRHDASAITLATRVWVKSENYWDVYFDLMEQVKVAFDENEIEIPFNQLDVHITK